MIAIVDYDIGNLAAIANMLQRVGTVASITADPTVIERSEGIILPGNGAFDACMKNIRATGLVPLLERLVLIERKPLLGICVGAQMLGHGSEEGSEKGLGWINLHAKRFPQSPSLRIPHMGWNEVQARQPKHPLTEGMADKARFYFVHSYYLEPADPADILLSTHYGIEFASGIACGNISGVQFHPEKSHRFGKQLLGNFSREVRCTATA